MTYNAEKTQFDQIEKSRKNMSFAGADTEIGALKVWLDAFLTLDLTGMRVLTVKFLRGELFLHFSHSAPVDLESNEILPELILLNEHGFLTECSQPGRAETGDGDAQRAFVCGYASEGTARRIEALTLFTDLIVIVVEPGASFGHSIPVTTESFHPYTWAGSYGPASIEPYEGFLSEAGLGTLANSCFVTVIDPRWGRRLYLWEQVLYAVKKQGDHLAPWDTKQLPVTH